jgi:hypothetical protein
MDGAIAFFESLLEENTWKRVGYVVAGGILILTALMAFQPVRYMTSRGLKYL